MGCVAIALGSTSANLMCRFLYAQAISHDRHLQGTAHAPKRQHPTKDS